MFGDELVQAMREFKAIWDPDGKMNPGKVVDANPLDSDLRLGPRWPAARPDTHFSYPADGGLSAYPPGASVSERVAGTTPTPAA